MSKPNEKVQLKMAVKNATILLKFFRFLWNYRDENRPSSHFYWSTISQKQFILVFNDCFRNLYFRAPKTN